MDKGFAHELDFWKGFVKTERFQKHWISDDPNPELREIAREIILAENPKRVLDIGCGAASILRGTIPRRNIFEADPLADEYREIYPDCEVVKMFVEDISVSGFDLVHISNAFDHCQDPLRGLLSLIDACKPGGLVYIQGFVNEAMHQENEGLHQWDISVHANMLIVGGKYEFCYKAEQLVAARVEPCRINNNNWFHYAFRKV